MTLDFSHSPPREAARNRLAEFVPLAGRSYADRRNYDLGPGQHVHVSRLSPYIRTRLITEEDVLRAVLAQHTPRNAEKFIQEVFWRTYWKGWLEMRPGVWRQYQGALRRRVDELNTQSGLRSAWEDACYGRTGITCFDEWARELVETGYLHNHARMWFASIWIFTLKLPWELGADFFLRHLLDGDPASNTLSWRWVGGLQTQGKTYLARVSNISKFTEGRFHPKWELAGEALPLSGPANPERGACPVGGTPDPTKKSGLILHGDDLSPWFLDDLPVASVAVLRREAGLSPLHMSKNVVSFLDGAFEDTLRHYGLTPDVTCEDVEGLVDWAREHQLAQIVCAMAPVGPTATTLREVAKRLDILLVQIQRPYDAAAWPHATHGFFRFKEHIPSLIEQMGLEPQTSLPF